MKLNTKNHCLICSKPVVGEYLPFCSARCKQVDLGRWFSEAYSIPTTEQADSELAKDTNEAD